jgi:hypothetical protein
MVRGEGEVEVEVRRPRRMNNGSPGVARTPVIIPTRAPHLPRPALILARFHARQAVRAFICDNRFEQAADTRPRQALAFPDFPPWQPLARLFIRTDITSNFSIFTAAYE